MKNEITVNKSILNKTKTNLILDIALFLVFLVVYESKATGETIHEWLGVALTVATIVHILWHWTWIVGVTQRFFQNIKTEPRLNYIIGIVIFIGFTTTVFSGLMMSRSVLPFFGLTAANTPVWKMLHSQAADVTLWTMAAHIALHWRWLINAVKRHMLNPVKRYFSRNNSQVKPPSAYTRYGQEVAFLAAFCQGKTQEVALEYNLNFRR